MANQEKLQVLKFGGTSVGSEDAIHEVLSIVRHSKADRKVVVVSAPSGVTNMLLRLVEDLNVLSEIKERITTLVRDLRIRQECVDDLMAELETDARKVLLPSQKSDLIASYGERFSIQILAEFFTSNGIEAVPVDSRDFVVTDNNFTNAAYDFEATRIKAVPFFNEVFSRNQLPIVSGFIGNDLNGRTTTLGRGGSDLSATLIGQCLQADSVEIWTDANGIMTADPRKIKDSRTISTIGYRETFELSNFGAKVIYSKSLIPGFRGGFPIRVLNTFNPNIAGTLITNDATDRVFSITTKENISVLTVFTPEMIGTPGYLAKLFRIFEQLEISIDVISVSEASVSLTVHNLSKEAREGLQTRIHEIGDLRIRDNCSIVAVISNVLQQNQNYVTESVTLLNQNNINIEMISFGNTEINLTLVVDANQTQQALETLHNHFMKKF